MCFLLWSPVNSMGDSCCVCSVETEKYRCPRCKLRYCSLACCKTHKDRCVPKEATSSERITSVPGVLQTRDLLEDTDESDAVPLQKLMLLGKSEELKDIFRNSHLRQLLVTLDQTGNKDESLKKYMQEPLFVEFVDKCLSIIDAEKNLFAK
ncbi:zinc finger HIT domain-containing protein 3 [Leptodactylus fuscus]|uniref:zinc finger HIT domain-containing protein 3 n=1 Tax=Leptodactylus fuscus TaxID=238119 RepID=UPI003F4EE2DC